MTDIHCHILPGIDDGPPDMAASLEMALVAVGSGITTVVATPHLRADFPDVDVHELHARCQELSEALDREQIELAVIAGAETSLGWALNASEDELRLASVGQKGRTVLIETPREVVDWPALAQALFALRLRGVDVILAHPERSVRSYGERQDLRKLASQGILLQVNAGSLLTGRASTEYRIAQWLCREGVAGAVASDAHRGDGWRPITKLALAATCLSRDLGRAASTWLTSDSPLASIDGRRLPPFAQERRSRSSWLRARLAGR